MYINIEDIAQVAYNVNRAYCEAIGEGMKPWDDVPEQHDNYIDAVKWRLENPDAKVEAQHNEWLESKKKEGWKFGTKKDDGKKEHPYFVPFEQLSTEMQAKDYLFKATVLSLQSFLSPLNDYATPSKMEREGPVSKEAQSREL